MSGAASVARLGRGGFGAGLLVLGVLAAPPACAAQAGFASVNIPDPGNPPIETAIWYPTAAPAGPVRIGLDTVQAAQGAPMQGGAHTLIVISHGQGGGSGSHIDTAAALAEAGFVVAAPAHTGDNFRDQSRVVKIWDRTRQLHLVADWMLAQWPEHARLLQDRIGVFGFSAGGFTALVAAGGEPDLSKIAPHCATHPQEFTCGLVRQATHGGTLPQAPPGGFVHDPRVAAAVIAAPALGFTFGRQGLAGVQVPVQLWRAAADDTLPEPFYAQAVKDALPKPPEYHVVPNAVHLDFLSPCDARKASIIPQICQSRPGFDRTAFHASFDTAVVQFFRRSLPNPGVAAQR